MALKVFLASDYKTTHERIFFDEFVEKLKSIYDATLDRAILIGNLSAISSEMDAVFMKNDSVTVIDFKNYGGEISFFENGSWFANEDVEIKGGNQKNPFLQLKKNKFDLLEFCTNWQSRFIENDRSINWGHISGMALFHKPIEFDNYSMPDKIRTWFHVVDADNAVRRLENITSRTFNFSNKELDLFIEAANLQSCLFYETPQELLDIFVQEKEKEQEEVCEKELIITGAGFSISDSEKLNINQRYKNFFTDNDWKIVHSFVEDAKEGEVVELNGLDVTSATKQYVDKKYNSKLFKHQLEGLKEVRNNKNVCITTSTASGKSTVFFTSGIDLLSRKASSKIIAIYPVKALGNEQTERWTEALKLAGLSSCKVGRIDGSVKVKARTKILKESSVVIMTPDVMHAWLLNGMTGEKSFKLDFLKALELVIVDEAHIYKGVFGSNTAYLFRRLNHIVSTVSGQMPQYLAASATIESADDFLNSLIGVKFEIIGSKYDSAPKNEYEVLMVEPNDMTELNTKLVELISFSAKQEDAKFINFVDSRLLVSSITRGVRNTAEGVNSLEDLGVFPYRSGFEDTHRREIEAKLSNGDLKGVVSTSALELGIDIDGLNVGILFGVPYTATSYFQRIGRVGRHGKGLIIIINDGYLKSQTVFSQPDQIKVLPLIKNSLYLENEQLNNIHTACMADNEYGELNAIMNTDEEFDTQIDFSNDFVKLCNDVMTNTQGRAYSNFRGAFDSPHFEFPLRNLSTNYKVKFEDSDKGFINKDQMMREAYPGAVYEYFNETYRVSNINERAKEVYLKSTHKNSYSSPIKLPKGIQPTYNEDCLSHKYGNSLITRSGLNIREVVLGFYDHKGSQKTSYNYGDSECRSKNVFYKKTSLVNNIITTGVCLYHPSLNGLSSEILEELTRLIYDMFIVISTYDSQDISYGFNKSRYRGESEYISKDDYFIAIYDQNRGSLRLTDDFFTDDVFKRVIKASKDAIEYDSVKFSENTDVLLSVLTSICNDLDKDIQKIDLQGRNIIAVLKTGVKVKHVSSDDFYLIMGYKTPLKEKMNYNTAIYVNGVPDFSQQKDIPMSDLETDNKDDYISYDLDDECIIE